MQSKDQAKVICIIVFVGALVCALLTGDSAIQTTRAFSSGPDAGLTGAPGELTCAVASCHRGSLNAGPGQVLITAPTSYQPGMTYEITVKHMTGDSSRRRWGFQLTVLDGTNRKAGALRNLSGLTQVLVGGPGGTREYIEHNFLGTFQGQAFQASWSFNWVAPSTDAGPVTMYAAGNHANNDGDNSGDQIYTVMTSIPGAPAAPARPPVIDAAAVSGKRLILGGSNFGDGVTLFMDGERVRKVFNDEENPTTVIVARKAGKLIAPSQTVLLKIVNPDGAESNVFSFTRPAE